MPILMMIFLLALSSDAEYRAFQLEISKGSEKRNVLSTLDDLQYPEYYPVQFGEQVSILDSWMCKGRTDDYLSICAPNREPAESGPIAGSPDKPKP